MRVPALVTPDGEILIQSLAIIEYLDETHPAPPFLPKDPIARARVRALAEIVACDIHPLNNIGPLRYLKNEMHQDQSRDRRLVSSLGDDRIRGDRGAVRRRPLCLRRRGNAWPISAWCRRSTMPGG